MAHTAVANYEAERKLFAELLAGEGEPNILCFQGESGTGKSHLIEHCVRGAGELPAVLIKLQGGGEAIPTLFTRMGSACGWSQLPSLTGVVATLLERPGAHEESLWLMGMHRHLREIGQVSDMEIRLDRYQLLADAWFADAMSFERPFLLALDGYEARSTLFDRWFSQDFLVGAAHAPQMKVLVGGQSLPTPHEGWSFSASVRELKGVHEAEAWLSWATAAGYQLPSLEVMVGIVIALQGNPSQIIRVIESQFPRDNGASAPKGSIYEQRRLIRKNLTSAFSLSELKDICFDLEIAYEALPDHDHLSGFVRELLAYTGRVGRLDELLHICRAERPHLAW